MATNDFSRPTRTTSRRSKALRRLFIGLLLLGLLVFAAPWIIGGTSLRNTMLAQAVPKEVGTLTAGGASLGWWSPVSLQQVQLNDPNGVAIFQAATIELDRSLIQLWGDRNDLGTLRVDRPMLAIAVRPGGSNVEDLITLLNEKNATGEPEASAPGETNAKPSRIEITRGAIQMTELAGQRRQWTIDELAATVDLTPAIPTVAASAIVYAGGIDAGSAPSRNVDQPPPRNAGAFRVVTTADANVAVANVAQQRLELTASRLPLAPLEPWLVRFDPRLRLTGMLTGSGQASWRPVVFDARAFNPQANNASPQAIANNRAAAILATGITSQGEFKLEQLEAYATALGTQPLRLASARAPWRFAATPDGRLTVEQLALQSELGEAKLSTALTPPELAGLLAGDWRAVRAGQLEADLDLAQLARLAPTVVRLRDDTAIQSGRVQLALSSTNVARGRRLVGRVDTSELTALAAGRVIAWDHPLEVRFDATETPGGLMVDLLRCDSEFLMLTGQGNQANLQASGQFDLDKLAQQLGRFVDLSGWRLAGRGELNLTVQRPNEQRFNAKGNIDLTDAIVATTQRTWLTETKLKADFTGTGDLNPQTLRPVRWETGEVNVTAGNSDTLNAKLVEPITLNRDAAAFTGQVKGELDNWARRLRMISPGTLPKEIRLAGMVDAAGTAAVSAQRVEVSQMRAIAKQFELEMPGVNIREPHFEIGGGMAWDQTASRLDAANCTLVTSSLTMRGSNLQLATGANGAAQAAGRMAVNIDLARLANWFPAMQEPDAIRPAGKVVGEINLQQQNGQLMALLDLNGQQVALKQRNQQGVQTLWQEPTLKIGGQAAYTPANDSLALNNLSVEASKLRVIASGKIEQVSTQQAAQLAGTIDYDLAEWAPVLAASLGQGIQIAGKDRAQFQLAGLFGQSDAAQPDRPLPHWSQRFTGRIEAPWQNALVYGLPIGPGKIGLALQGGIVRSDPLDIAIGDGGRLTTQPLVQLDPPPSFVALPTGPVLTGVRITPEVSEQMLKYVAPVLAGATRSEGLFSLQTTGLRAPLGDFKQLETTGQLAVQSVKVVPGPMVKEWVTLARQVEALAKNQDLNALVNRPAPTLLSVTDRTVNFRVSRGRVYHEGLQFDVGDVAVMSTGSVGLDETLELQLSVPIQDRWIAGKQYLVGLRGQSVQIPVGGTFAKPRIDNRAVANMSRQLIGNAAQGAIQNEIGKAFDKLFGK